MKNLPKYFTIVRIIGEVVMLFFVFQNSHWSVFGSLLLITFSIEGISATFAMQARMIRAINQVRNNDKKEFNEFIFTINQQAEAVKKQMNVCRECEMHGQHGIRPGSIHHKDATNCLMNPDKTKVS